MLRGKGIGLFGNGRCFVTRFVNRGGDSGNRVFDLADLRMHLANQIVLRLRQLLDAAGLLLQSSQERVLPSGYAVHPPKANDPAERRNEGNPEFQFAKAHSVIIAVSWAGVCG